MAQRCHEPELDPATLAAAFGLSRRQWRLDGRWLRLQVDYDTRLAVAPDVLPGSPTRGGAFQRHRESG